MPPSRSPALSFIFLTLVLDTLGIGVIIPVAPKLVENMLGGDTSRATFTYGLLLGTYAAMQFVFAPILGSLSDRFGRRPVILLSLLGSAIDYFAMAWAPSLWIFFLTRAINGVSGANITACTSYIADITPREKRAAGFGLIGAAFGIGFALGPVLGGVLGGHHIRAPFLVSGALTLVNWLYGCFVLPESLPPERRRPFTLVSLNPLRSIWSLREYPLAAGLALTLFLVNLAQFGLQAIWALYTSYRYKWSEVEVGVSLAIVGVAYGAVQGGLSRKLIPRLGEPRSVLFGLVVGTLAYVGYALATDGWMIYAIIALASIGAIAHPAAQAIVSGSVPPDRQGQLQGSLMSLSSLAAIIGPPWASSLFGYFILPEAPARIPGAAFFSCALLALLGLANAVRVFGVQKNADAQVPDRPPG